MVDSSRRQASLPAQVRSSETKVSPADVIDLLLSRCRRVSLCEVIDLVLDRGNSAYVAAHATSFSRLWPVAPMSNSAVGLQWGEKM